MEALLPMDDVKDGFRHGQADFARWQDELVWMGKGEKIINRAGLGFRTVGQVVWMRTSGVCIITSIFACHVSSLDYGMA